MVLHRSIKSYDPKTVLPVSRDFDSISKKKTNSKNVFDYGLGKVPQMPYISCFFS